MSTIVVRVRDVMDTNMFFVDASAKVMEVLNIMLDKGVWSVVVEKDSLPLGVITERDITRRCIVRNKNPNLITAEEIMSSPLITIDPDQPIMEAMKLMTFKGVRRLYVIEKGKIIGRVTQTGLISHMLEVLMAFRSLWSPL